MEPRAATGIRGEDAAAAHYVGRGYRVVARNWRCRIGELDLVAARADTVVVVEVKTRRGSGFGAGYEAVGARKRAKIRAVTEVFVQHADLVDAAVRFDVASVRLRPDSSAEVEVFEDAF